MLKAIIFGASDTGKRIYEEIKEKEEVIGFVDYDALKMGGVLRWGSHRGSRDIIGKKF